MAYLEKSFIYFGGLKPDIQQNILEALEFTRDELPFRYLGIPLSSKRLSIMQCKRLIDKILTRIKSWTTRFLSYAERLLLVKTVLFSIQVFWSQVFVLPKKGLVVWEAKTAQASWMVQNILKARKTFQRAGLSEQGVTLMETYSIKKLYIVTREDYLEVPWIRLIWNNVGAPKWVFIMYLALHRRLQTKDRIASWANIENLDCPLCQDKLKEIDHTLFKCEYARRVWEKLLVW
ncbi:uncharacterized protein LOC132062399 [Lycium ferocissimum]|uniref:uncharacterized protein LOC132062399 n=1 Tax=Lycium ferocissimum TaxID=112874 RepID=UPI00281615D0|nr:uncharacterized protein LOC132062399 [Lycium ferocissimum]